MDLSAPARDIDDLVASFVKTEGVELGQMKELWRARNFSFIHEAKPKDVSPAFYAQGLFSSALSHIVGNASLSSKLGGLYVLYILHCTQERMEASYRIYLSLEELEAMYALVKEIKVHRLAVAMKVVRKMFAENMFLFGSVSVNQKRIAATVARLVKRANSRVQQARSRVLSDSPVRQHLESRLREELGLTELSQLTEGYAAARRRALAGDLEGEGGEQAMLTTGNGNDPPIEPSFGPGLIEDASKWEERRLELLGLVNRHQQQENCSTQSATGTRRRKVRSQESYCESLEKRQQLTTITEDDGCLRESNEDIDLERELVEELHRVLDND